MNDNERLKNTIRKDLDARADHETYEHMLSTVLRAHEPMKKTKPASGRNWERNMIMKNPITKLAVAAAILAAVVLGLFEFISTDTGSGIVWAEVAQKVQASQGVIYRERGTSSQHAPEDGSGYSITHLSPTQYRSDSFRAGQPWITMYDNRETGQRVALVHPQKGYVIEEITLTAEGDRKHAQMMDPRWWVRQLMSCEHTKLETQIIDGVLCEGLETTDLALVADVDFQIDDLSVRLWVSVETDYPVRLESEFSGEHSGGMTYDRFQWDVLLDASVFEPNIPADYEQM